MPSAVPGTRDIKVKIGDLVLVLVEYKILCVERH